MKEYFSHDYATREDEKIKKLMYAHSWIGYGLYWGIIECLYQNDGYLDLDYNRIAFDMRTHSELIDSIINDFELFKIKGNKFYSVSVLNRIMIRNEKSKKARDSALRRWNTSNKDDAIALRTDSDSNAIKEKKRKEKNIKDINIRINNFEKEVLEYQNIYDYDMLREFFSYWSELNPTKTKMKKELQKTWETKLRLVTWKKNSKRFTK